MRTSIPEPLIWSSTTVHPHAVERVLPDPRVQLLFNLDADALRWLDAPTPGGVDWQTVGGAALNGPFDRPFCIDPCDQRRLIGAVLPVGAAARWLGVPADELAGHHLDLTQLPALSDLRQRLGDAPWSAAPGVLRAELRRRLTLAPVPPVIRFALAGLANGRTVRAIERDLNMSPKRLRRRFRAAVGLTPKRYQRVLRFRRTIHQLAMARPPIGLAELAVAAGYSDQAHMTHEFRALGGTTPAAYRPRAPQDVGHVSL